MDFYIFPPESDSKPGEEFDKEPSLLRCLSLDLEVSPKDDRIRALAGVSGDSVHSLGLTLA